QEAQGLRGQGAAAGSGGPGDPQDRPGGGPRDGRGDPQRPGRHQPIPQRQDCLRLRRTGAGGTAERGEEVQGHEDHQGRLGTFAVGAGGDSLAAGRQKPEMGCPVLSVDASQRQEAGLRGGGQEAALRALRHAQDVDSVQDRNHADHGASDNSQEVGQDIDSGPDHNHGDHGSSDNSQEVGQDVDSGPDHNHGNDGSSDNSQEVAQDIDSGPDHNHGGDGSSDNWQEVGQAIDSGPDHNPVAGPPVPEKEGRARPNRTQSL